ncbi:type III-A CRISPR-associated protein Csm2 [bacterium]|nr:type III-A CRISPR-associated protein Csm2 [bacterium]
MSAITLWQDSEKKIISPQLFSEAAEKLAKEIGGEGYKVNKGTQLRRFYDEIVRLQSQAKSLSEDDTEKWANLLPYIHMLVAKAAYAQGRGLVSPSFVNLLKSGISQIETRRDLTIFANFFESFMGFYKLHGPK